MRRLFATAAIALLAACAGSPDQTTACAEPRPTVCAMQFLPTCAVLASGGRKEFTSPCTACMDADVTGYVAGACPE